MKAEEALEQSQGKPVYAVHHGDFYILYQREDGNYTLEFSDLKTPKRRGMYTSHSLDWVLIRDRRYIAEWYLTEDGARNGKRPEEFHIYTMALYQDKETLEIIQVRFCNGEVISIAEHRTRRIRSHAVDFDRTELRDFLLNSDQYTFLTSWWVQTIKQSELDAQWIAKQAKREHSYHYVYFNLRDNQEHDEWHETIAEVADLALAHFRGEKKKPLYIEGPKIGKLLLQKKELPNGRFVIPGLEPYLREKRRH